MRSLSYVPALLLLATPIHNAQAADQNGYTAQYECRAGNPNCNVDVASLARRSCDQVVGPSDPWSTINWSNNTICLEAGDHTAKGTLSIPSTANGTSGNYKVLRYYRPQDSDDEPWNQSSQNRATVRELDANGRYWIAHRITLDGGLGIRVNQMTGTHNIFNRMLVERYSTGAGSVQVSGDDNTVQNSVLRDTGITPNTDRHCMTLDLTARSRIVNNEFYDCSGDGIQNNRVGDGSPDTVVENNDFYITADLLVNGGQQSCAENGMDLKRGGSAGHPLVVIHNRFWGFRPTDQSCGASGSGGEALVFHREGSYGLIQNNIFVDVPPAIVSPNEPPARYSIIGNLIFDANHGGTYAININKASSTEVYLNTIISATNGIAGGGTSNDVQCNVMIAAGGSSGTYNNEYYPSAATRSSGAAYSVGQIIRTAPHANCVKGHESACFLYRVTKAGMTAPDTQNYCNTLGCKQQDGSVELRAIRGPYTFFRKLRTSPEAYTIPYARVYGRTDNPAEENAPEAYACRSDYSARQSIGINNE
jgi:hypothetical protein